MIMKMNRRRMIDRPLVQVGTVLHNGRMTERKPPGVSFESFVDKQIRDAEARGQFANLPDTGRPADVVTETSYDENWWIKRKMAREGLSVLPPTLALRKEAEDTLAAVPGMPSEQAVRRAVERLNAQIRDMMFRPPPGPPLGLGPYDVEAVVREWREGRATG
ncbi:DnaJ-like, subfamily C, domain-containing protein [Actinobacteria bacterium OK074]|nr:DnaJ-like, subfamily C, domain-containing protein [Actinobacteria bacterium OK074]